MSCSTNNKYNGTTLIAKPKTFLERENNTLYYQNIGFSKRELHITKQNKMTEEKVLREIAKHGGGSTTLAGGYAGYSSHKKYKGPVTEHIKCPEQSNTEDKPIKTENEQHLQDIKSTIDNLKCKFQEVESWEDLDVCSG